MKQTVKQALLALLLSTASVHLWGGEHRIGDAKHSMVFNSSGTLKSWKIHGTEYLLQSQPLFSVKDVEKNREEVVTGTFSKRERGVFFKGVAKKNNLAVEAFVSFKSATGSMRTHVAIMDLTKSDRAVDFNCRLTMKKSPWHFCSYWEKNQNEPIKTIRGRGYANSVRVGAKEFSQSPWLIVDDTRNGILLSHSMMKPRFFNYSFMHRKDDAVELSLSVPLGLSQDTKKFPGKAYLEFDLTPFGGNTFVRGGADLYYQLYPEVFRCRLASGGGWALWVGENGLDVAKACGIGFNQLEFDVSIVGSPDKDVAIANSISSAKAATERDIKTMAYSEPWGIWLPFPNNWLEQHHGEARENLRKNMGEEHVLDDSLKEYIESFKGDMATADRFPGELTRDDIYHVIQNCAVQIGKDGRWGLRGYGKKGFHWGGRKGWDAGLIMVNTDPEIERPNRLDITWEKARYANIEKYGLTFDGVYLDSETFFCGWDEFNYNRKHWAVADEPLTYFKDEKGNVSIGQSVTLAHTDFLKYNRKLADEHGYFVACNTWDPLIPFLIPYVDLVGAGEHWDKEKLPPLTQFKIFRFLAYRKPVSTMDYSLSFDGGVPATLDGAKKYIEPRLNKCLMYGIYPGTANAWNCEAKTKLMEVVFRPYTPLFKAINEAGWEPLTRLQVFGVDTAKVCRERWGNNTTEGLYFTLRNMADSEVVLQLALSRKDFGKITSVKQLLEGKSLEVRYAKGNYLCSMQIPSKRTVVIKCE